MNLVGVIVAATAGLAVMYALSQNINSFSKSARSLSNVQDENALKMVLTQRISCDKFIIGMVQSMKMSLLSPPLEAFFTVATCQTVHGAAKLLRITRTGVTL